MNEIEGENPVGNRPTQGADDNSINISMKLLPHLRQNGKRLSKGEVTDG